MAVAASGMDAGQRRLVYGLNVLLAVLLALAATALAVWGAGRLNWSADLSSAGVNSLSPRTQGLLRDLNQDVRITALYSTALKDVRPLDEKRRNRVADLLGLYESAGRGRVTTAVLDPRKDEGKLREALKRLQDKPLFRDEAKPQQELLAGFPKIYDALTSLAKSETTELERLAQADPRLKKTPELAIIRRGFDQITTDAGRVAKEIKDAGASDVPRYGAVVNVMKESLTSTQATLQNFENWMSGEGAGIQGLAPETAAYLRGARERFAPVMALLNESVTKLQTVAASKLEDVLNGLSQPQTILIETDSGAEVRSLDDVWPMRNERNAPPSPDGDQRDFAGEQAISSAILKLTQTEKTAVVFVRVGGEPLLRPDFRKFNPMTMREPPQAPFEQLNALLERENFVTGEWDVAADPNLPKLEGAARTVYVVLPPPPPQRPNPMQPAPPTGMSPEQRKIIEDAVAAAGRAMFLASWTDPMSGGGYAWRDYLRSEWNIDVRSEFLVAQFAPSPEKRDLWWPASRDPGLVNTDVIRFTDHPIGKPVQGVTGAMYLVTPLDLISPDPAASRPANAPPPSDAKAEPIAEIVATEDVWATSNPMRVFGEDLRQNRGTRRRDDDLRPPFPIAAAAVKPDGKRLVVFGSERFAQDDISHAQSLGAVGGQLVLVNLYPANTDLFINALHWLTGDAARISVGAQRSDVPRLDKLKPGGMAVFWQVFLVAIWPALALLAGAGVWLMRRR